MVNLKITPRKIRFSLVSSIATTIDFGILISLTSLLGLPLIASNFISTAVSFIFSFFANKKFSFKTANHHIPREAWQFILVTLFGIWVIQPLIIWPLENLLESFALRGIIAVIIAKLIASIATFFWNYLWYTRVVFKKKN